MRKILITGGAGFIGSHLVERMCAAFPHAQIVVLDKMTYAADINYILPLIASQRVHFAVGDICDYETCVAICSGCDLVIHAAAESHVDRSFQSSILFTHTNTLGTHTIMEACRVTGVPRIIHVSTDEVYGEILGKECDETGILNPTNPYSASKAAAEMIVNGYRHSFKLPVIIVRANNVFGTRQFPEKLIPRSIMAILGGKKIELHGDGSNVRHYLCATDMANAIQLIAKDGTLNEIYNVGSPDEFSNRDVARMICNEMSIDFDENVKFVRNRPFNDRRYAISWGKLSNLGWSPQYSLPQELHAIVDWYRDNMQSIRMRAGKVLND